MRAAPTTTMNQRSRFGSRTQRKRQSALILVLLLVFVACATLHASAILFWPIKQAPSMGSINTWSTSVKAIMALEAALDSEEVRQEVHKALQDASKGFLPCHHNLYRCDDTGSIVEVVIDDFAEGRVRWSKFPASVKRILVRNSSLRQPLVLTELPLQLEEFTAVDTTWLPRSLLVHPHNVQLGGAAPLLSCDPGRGAAADCVYALNVLQCVGCALTAVTFSGVTPLFPRLINVNLNHNPELALDVRTVPSSVVILHVSHTQLGYLNVAEVVRLVPQHLQVLNISYTGARFEWGMLLAAPPSLTVVDLSGLPLPSAAAAAAVRPDGNGGGEDKAEGNDGAPAVPPSSSAMCAANGSFSPTQLYLSHCGIAGELPHFAHCNRLVVLEMTHNALSSLRLEHLPPSLHMLNLNNNAFAGALNLSQLPRGIWWLKLSFNRFTGGVSMADLPPQIEYLDVSYNMLSGQVNLTQLPESIKFVYLQHNNFTGEADLVEIPLGLRFIMIHHNNWDYRLPAP